MPETIGRYELIKEISSDVQLAIDDKKLVVVKRLDKPLDKRALELAHPNIARVFELGDADGRPFVAMEYLEGEPLAAVLEAPKRLDPLSLARIVADATQALASTDLVHHAIAPSNIFVLYSGQVKVLAFGGAKRHVAYTAPEKLDERPGDRRSDIWSLGCVLWEALAHKRLFKGTNDTEIVREVRYVNVRAPSSVNAEAPKELDAIVLRCLQRDPSKRYGSAMDLAGAIEEVLAAKEYPSKNFKIGTFMMQAFQDRVAARERLLRDVAGPERPSAEVIEAAFVETRAEPPDVFDIDAFIGSAAPNQVVLPEGSTGADAAVATPAENPFDEEAVATVFDDVPANAEASRVHRDTPDPSWMRDKHGKAIEELQRRAQAERQLPEVVRRRRMMRIAAAVGGVLVLVIVVAGVKSCGKKQTPSAPVAQVPVAIDAAPRSDAAIATVSIDAAPVTDDTEEVAEIEMPPDEVPEKPIVAVRPKPTKSAQKLYAEGLAAWKKKDTKTAYARFTEGRRASSTYPNNWYGLGLVHEKAGRKKDARTAYERYLKLAPKAPNAAKLRDHIKKKLM